MKAPRPRPFELTDRHRFSPSEENFNQALSNWRAKYRCNPELYDEIELVAWLSVFDGNPTYARKFAREKLIESDFVWIWLDEYHRSLKETEDRPITWETDWNIRDSIPAETMWFGWIACVEQLSNSYKKIPKEQQSLKIFPEWKFVARPNHAKDCSFTKMSCEVRNKTLTDDLKSGHYETYHPAFPLDPSSVWLSTPKDPI